MARVPKLTETEWDKVKTGQPVVLEDGREFVKVDRVFARDSAGALEAFGRFTIVKAKAKPKQQGFGFDGTETGD
jgi:hypothetical protein